MCMCVCVCVCVRTWVRILRNQFILILIFHLQSFFCMSSLYVVCCSYNCYYCNTVPLQIHTLKGWERKKEKKKVIAARLWLWLWLWLPCANHPHIILILLYFYFRSCKCTGNLWDGNEGGACFHTTLVYIHSFHSSEIQQMAILICLINPPLFL